MTISTTDRQFLVELMRRNAGVALEAGQEHLIANRLAIVAARRKLANPAALIAQLRFGKDPALLHDTIDALCTHETSFFRDVHPFDALAEQILPALAARRRQQRTLRVWCAACSSGQEVWSTAITVRERVDDLQGWTVRILATDVSQAMVERTRAATYTDAELARGMSERLRTRYFVRQGDLWQARPDLRAMVEVARANLLEPPPTADRYDLILVRNVLIYFDADGKRRVLDRLHASLAPDGALMIGTGENLIDPRYEARTFGRTIVYSPRGAAPPLARARAQESP